MRQIQRFHKLRNLRQLPGGDSVLAQIESSYPPAQVAHLRKVIVGQVQLGDVSDVLQLSGNFLQLQPGQDQPLDGKTLVDTSQSGHAGTCDAGIFALAALGTDVRG